jgi:Fe(3+) dicitrate transport protein
LLHLSAGLTDEQFKIDPQASVRDRNWFEVQWNLPALTLDYQITPNTKLNVRTFVLNSHRNSIEFTRPVDQPDDMGFRDLRKDEYLNFGTEIRVLNSYHLFATDKSSISAGVRLYNGRTKRGQGLGTANAEPEFRFINPDNLEYSDYTFRTYNYSFFLENIFWLSRNLSVTPGVRYEVIRFTADGYYGDQGQPSPNKFEESERKFPLLGVGAQYHISDEINVYANYTEGYRSANFNDIRITNPNLKIDEALKDSHGYNIDVGIRGIKKGVLSFDINGFYLRYTDKIGIATRVDENGDTYQFSTNIADSRNFGMESLVDVNLFRLFNVKSKGSLSFYTSYAYIDAKYTASENGTLNGHTVEFAPKHILRSGLNFSQGGFSTTLSYSKTSEQFSDANNTVTSANGNQGIIKEYYVMDWSAAYSYHNYTLSLSVNNLTDNKYFTRRSTSYPGPGLIPSDPRSVAVTIGIKL